MLEAVGGAAVNPLQYGFMRNALLGGTALSLLCGVVGYYLVLRHDIFAGESLSDVAFTGAMGGAVACISPFGGMLLGTLLAAFGLAATGRRLRERDVVAGTVLAGVLGLGVLFLSLFATRGSGGGTGISGVSILFGSILSITGRQALLLVGVAAGVAVMLLAMARPLFYASIDPEAARTRGVPVRLLGFVFMGLLALTTVEAVQAVGAMLVFALLLLPAATAQQLTLSHSRGVALAAALALLITWSGLVLGYYSGLPVSVCISLLAVGAYVLAHGAQRLWRAGPVRQPQAA